MEQNFEVTGNKAISRSCGHEHIFEIVEKMPSQYHIWNIGDNMGNDEYIPLCEMLYPASRECFHINVDTLKTIKLPTDEVLTLRKAAHEGITNKEQAEKILRSKGMSARSQLKRIYAERAIKILNRITSA